MALNQIHYASIQNSKGGGSKEVKMTGESINHEVLQEFIAAHRDLLVPELFSDVLKGIDKAISLALGIIHHKTLESKKVQMDRGVEPNKSYKVALLYAPNHFENFNPVARASVDKLQCKRSLFFTGFNDKLSAAEIWKFFKTKGRLRDIILPKSIDKYNKRFGFVVVESEDDARALIKTVNGMHIGTDKIYLTFAKGEGRLGASKKRQSRAQTSTSKPTPNPNFMSQAPSNISIPIVNTKRQNLATKTKTAITPSSSIEKPKEKASSSKSNSILLKVNDSFSKELVNSVLLETINKESVESVSLVVEGLGFHDVLIRGITRTTFLAYFSQEKNLDGVDLKFLEIGFKEVRKVGWNEIIPMRRTWIECRGLPAIFWSEENFDNICSKTGKIIE